MNYKFKFYVLYPVVLFPITEQIYALSSIVAGFKHAVQTLIDLILIPNIPIIG